MKRSLILSFCAVAVAALGMSAAHAGTDAALNLRYTQPADPSEGGTWTLVAKTDDPNSDGLTALVARFNNIDPNSISIDGGIGHDIGISGGVFGTTVEVVYGQDPNDGLTAGVGLGGGPDDPLNNAAWDGATVIATGTFGGLRPEVDPNSTPGANYNDTGLGISASTVLSSVRGDSLNTLGLESPGGAGLLAGDANRDGSVGPADVSALSGGFGTGSTWDVGDFNADGSVGPADVSALSGTFGLSGTPPAIGAIPEPTSIVLLGIGCLAFFGRGRNRS